MNIQRKNSAHHFLMQSEREQTLVIGLISLCTRLYASLVLSWCLLSSSKSIDFSSFDPFGSGKILRLWL